MLFNWIKKFGNGLSSTNDLVLPSQTTSTTSINIETGIPELQEQDPDGGGQYVKRAEMNGILQALSDPLFDRQGGGQITFDDAYSTQNGGYSAGTVLYCASNNSYQRSLIDSNNYNFIDNTSYINDGTHWVTQSSFMPDITDNTSTGTVNVTGAGGLIVNNNVGTRNLSVSNQATIFFANMEELNVSNNLTTSHGSATNDFYAGGGFYSPNYSSRICGMNNGGSIWGTGFYGTTGAGAGASGRPSFPAANTPNNLGAVLGDILYATNSSYPSCLMVKSKNSSGYYNIVFSGSVTISGGGSEIQIPLSAFAINETKVFSSGIAAGNTTGIAVVGYVNTNNVSVSSYIRVGGFSPGSNVSFSINLIGL